MTLEKVGNFKKVKNHLFVLNFYDILSHTAENLIFINFNSERLLMICRYSIGYSKAHKREKLLNSRRNNEKMDFSGYPLNFYF